MHIHTRNEEINPEKLIADFEASGVYGGCVFSPSPDISVSEGGMNFDDRLKTVLAWSKGYEDRIFPVMWIHPYEDNVLEKVKICVDNGIAAFKMICDCYYIYEEKPMELLRAIAKTGKPVFFHSGMLYMKGKNTELAKYNHPAHWEALLSIPGLRFSMAHCSWPWTDECIALYERMDCSSKWHIKPDEKPPEMYIDITANAPDIYRKDLLTKLFSCSDSIGNRIMFGTDCIAEMYDSEKTENSLAKDAVIMDKLGVSLAVRNKMYYQNVLRFLGREDLIKEEDCVFSDAQPSDFPCEPKVKEICRKWYEKLSFPAEYNSQFDRALKEIRLSDAIDINRYDLTEKDGRYNLLAFLFMCEKLSEQYKEAGIDEKILLDTLGDIVLWLNAWSEVKGEMYLGEIHWLVRHMKMKIFRLGALEFFPAKTYCTCPELGLKEGDNVVEIHIPAGTGFSPEACKEAINEATKFFAKYYPDFKYNHYTCRSWLLDTELNKFLKEESNIIKFQKAFDILPDKHKESYSALKFIFKCNTTRLTLRTEVCSSGFSEKLKKHVLSGGKLYEGFGIIKK